MNAKRGAAEPMFAERVIRWQRRHGRHDLPWQRNVEPYRTWVSEIMLQQTQVNTVIPYFNKFMSAFPTVQALAAAKLDNVLHHWSGLGYYSRARNLHAAAQQIVTERAGHLPSTMDGLQSLPGIGRSTAAAILALAFGERQAILDGNVKRVLARYLGIEGWPGKREVEKKLWALAESFLPETNMPAYTQGLMDLGATLCLRNRPTCGLCPLQEDCMARLAGHPEQYPGRKPKRGKPVREAHMLILRRSNNYLLQRRPYSGIWGGLWSFPQLTNKKDVQEWLDRHFPGCDIKFQELGEFRHSFTHFHLDVRPILIDNIDSPSVAMDDERWLWYNSAREPAVGLAAPVRKLIDQLELRQERA